MFNTRSNPQTGPAGLPSLPPATNGYASEHPPLEGPEVKHPRILEGHQIVGPNGEDEIEATDDRDRRSYDVRPDFLGFSYTWWLMWTVLVVIVFLPWYAWI